MQQYNRRENIRVCGVQEVKPSKNDGETVILNLAKTLRVNLRQADIQRAHRLGKKKKNIEKTSPIIVCFVFYKKTNELFYKKSKLKNLLLDFASEAQHNFRNELFDSVEPQRNSAIGE